MLELYNTLSKKLEKIRPLDGKTVKIYNCGPTAYDFAHIGNLRTFALQDLLYRYLEFRKFNVFYVMNVTDVDDKTIQGARKQNVSLKDYTRHYYREFLADLKTLGIKKPDRLVFATQNIREMVELIKKLLKKGIAYKSDDKSIYYGIKKFPEYGRLSRLKISKLKTGARVKSDEYEKTHAGDFVLWKAWQPHDREVYWDSGLGKGRPGWHTECSAMSMKYLGEHFDIHGGGVDLVFPHHENEIAQSTGATGKKFASHWMHFAHLTVNGKKMSKSLGNFYTLRDLHGYEPRAVRYTFFLAHYRDKLNFSLETLKQSQKVIDSFDTFTRKLLFEAGGKDYPKTKNLIRKALAGFEKHLDRDLDTPKMWAGLHSFIHQTNSLLDKGEISKKNAKEVISFLKKTNSVLGVFRFAFDEKLPTEITALVKKREELRAKKDFKKADEIRALLLEKGIQLDDTKTGVKWKKARQ